MLYFILFIISFIVFLLGTIASVEKGSRTKGKILQIVGGVLLMFSIMAGCDSCLSGKVNSGFNEFTGEPTNKDPFNHFNRRP